MRGFIKRLIVAGLSFVFGLRGTSLVLAGGAPPVPNIAADQSIAQAVVPYSAPPSDFHPLSASDAELEDHGFPPRPNVLSEPMAYAHWEKLVSVPKVAKAKLQQTTIYNGRVHNLLRGQTLRNGTVAATSLNWSGYAVIGGSGTFVTNTNVIFSEWVVPRAQQGFGVCDGGWDYSSQWDGFDGVTSNDVLQAGTEADAYCAGSTSDTFYSSWIEWAPAPEVRVSIPAARPGDLMISEVWLTLTPPYGHAYLVNYTLQQAQVYAFNPPGGATYLGDSAEWIEERPTVNVNGNVGLANLTNYVADQFNFAYAANSSNYFFPGASPAGTTTLAINMACPPWTPGSSCPSAAVISTPSLYGFFTLWFYDAPAL
jgi:hypothetical protein